LICELCALATHGTLWSFREIKYRWLLRSLPEPSGLIPDTDWISTDPAYFPPFGSRHFHITGQYDELLEFFKQELLMMGWNLQIEEEHGFDPEKDDYILSTHLLFADQEYLCLEIRVGTSVNDLGIQEEDRVWFSASIFEKEDAACSFW
jgi:hypothetical protein